MKRSLMLSVAIIFSLVVLLAACSSPDDGNSTEEETNETNKTTTPEPAVPLSMLVPKNDTIIDMETNWFSTKLEEVGNADITFVVAADIDQQKAILVNTGDYPDVFMTMITKSEQMKWGPEGILLPLNDLIDKHAPEVVKLMQEMPDWKKGITAPDGNIYLVPQINDCYHCTYADKAMINISWLEKINKPMPTTTDELFDVLMAFKNTTFEGVSDESKLIFTGALNGWHTNPIPWLMNAFIYTDPSYYINVVDGKVQLAANQPEWKQGMQFMNKLYTNGLFDEQALSNNFENIGKVVGSNASSAIGMITTGGMNLHIQPADPKYRDYFVIPPVTGPNGARYATKYFGTSTTGFALSNKANEAQQIAAVKILNHTMSEMGSVENYYGNEGDFWNYAPKDTKDVQGKPAKYVFSNAIYDAGANHNKSWAGIGSFAMTKELRFATVAPDDPYSPEGVELLLTQETVPSEGLQPEELFPQSFYISDEDADEFGQLTVQMKNYISSSFAEFVLGRESLDSGWESYLKGFDGLKLDRYLELCQKIYDHYVGK